MSFLKKLLHARFLDACYDIGFRSDLEFVEIYLAGNLEKLSRIKGG